MARGKDKEKPKGKTFEERYGGTLVDPQVIADMGWYPSGSLRLDAVLGGGWKMGQISEIWGPKYIGKSTIVARTLAVNIRRGCKTLYFDWEGGLDIGPKVPEDELAPIHREARGWLQKNGLDPYDLEHFRIARPAGLEAGYEMLIDIVTEGWFDIVVVDSLAAGITMRQAKSRIGEATYGSAAAINSDSLRRLRHAYAAVPGSRTSILLINQARENLNSTHGGLTSTGGKAIGHYARQVLRLKPTKDGKKTGLIEVETTKNAYFPLKTGLVRISPARGLDTAWEIMQWLVSTERVTVATGWYAIPEVDGSVKKVQGDEAAAAYIAAHPQMDAWLDEARASLLQDLAGIVATD